MKKKIDLYGYYFIGIAIYLILLISGGIKYEVNDDFVMTSISSGVYTGDIEEYIVFTNIILGKFFAFLYSHIEGVNVYFYFYFFLSLSCFLLLINRLMSSFKGKERLFYFLIMVFFIIFYQLLGFQFTTNSALAFITGFVFFYFSDKKKKHYIISFFLISLSILIRLEVALLLTIYLSVFLMFEWSRTNFNKDFFKLYFKYGIVLLVLIAFFVGIDYGYLYDSGYINYREFSGLRSFIFDGFLDYTNAIFKEVGWSSIEYDLFKKLAIIDSNNDSYSFENLKYIKENTVIGFDQLLASSVKHIPKLWVLLDVLLLLTMMKSKSDLFRGILLIGTTMIIFIGLTMFNNVFKFRVFYSIHLFIILVTIFSMKGKELKTYRMLAGSLLLIPLLYLSVSKFAMNDQFKQENVIEMLNVLKEKKANKVLYELPGVNSYKSYDIDKPIPKLKRYSFGWLYKSPHNEKLKRKYNLKSDFLSEDFCMYFVSNERDKELFLKKVKLIELYMKEKYDFILVPEKHKLTNDEYLYMYEFKKL